MKKKSYLIALSVIVMLGALVWFREPIKAAVGAFELNNRSQQPARATGEPISTSTLNYLTPGTGTTSATTGTRGTDSVAFNIFVVSSTSASTDLRAVVEFSNSTTSDPRDQVWFPHGSVLSADTATTSRLTSTAKEYRFPAISLASHYLATSTAANETFDQNTVNMYRVEIDDIKAHWTRLVVYMPTMGVSATLSTALSDFPSATSTNAGVYLEVAQKEPL